MYLISTPPQGLSAARNAGTDAATGEIVAFIDDDCVPDGDWLSYAIGTLTRSGHAGVGGPNLPPLDEPPVAACVAHAPGGPVHVLLSDTEAEHVAGCNMVFWRSALLAVGGFDPRFRQAGDDVDVCWRIRDAGLTLGFSPAALVWHRRRGTVRAYLRQQRSYGRAEALLEAKWPERYNVEGHVTWRGRIYQTASRRRRVIDYGPAGAGLFQPAVEPRAPHAVAAALMPEWYLAILVLAVASVLSPWLPLLHVPGTGVPAAPLALLTACVALVTRAVVLAASLTRHDQTRHALRKALLLAALVLLQPLARLDGRVAHGLTPWRRRSGPRFGSVLPHTRSVWAERGATSTQWLAALETELRAMRTAVIQGSRFDRWDLAVRVGAMGSAQVRLAIEEHGHGRQLVRYRVIARPTRRWLQLLAALTAACALAALLRDPAAAIVFGASAAAIALRTAADCTAASAAVNHALKDGG